MTKVNNKALVVTILPAITGLILGVAVGLSTLAPPLGKFILMLMAGTYFSVMFGLPVYLLALKLVIPNEYFNKRTEKM